MSGLTKLIYLDLFFDYGGNVLGKNGCRSIGLSMRNMKNLETFNIRIGSFNRIEAEGIRNLGFGIKHL